MTGDDAVERLESERWNGPFAPDLQRRAQAALEAGRVLVFPALDFAIATSEQRFLDPASLGSGRKNVSLDPATGDLGNSGLLPQDSTALATMMRRFADNAVGLVAGLLPSYAASLERARTSFRPAEIAGRNYSPRHDDRLLHIDAFPTRPLAGRRILRVFTNVAPDGTDREWRVGEPFADFAASFMPRIGRQLPGSAWMLHRLGLTKGRRSAYDHIMLALHDAGKLDANYQARCPKAELRFAAGSTWMCFTDQVLHAALAGHCALEQTFHLPVSALASPEQAPLRVLERLAGRALV